MISPAEVEWIRQRPTTPHSPVLSVYLDIDQSSAANLHREFESALKARLRAVEHTLAEPARAAFRADAAHVQRFVAQYHPDAKTLVVFADDSADFWWRGRLQARLPTDVRWEAG